MQMTGRRRTISRRGTGGALALLVVGILAAVMLSPGHGSPPRADGAAARPPNVVFVLTDDLAWNLVKYMPRVQALQRRGMTFSRYFVTDSLCCPSRSSIFTGRFPHDTGVFTNMGADGGFQTFLNRGWESRTWATALQPLGYRTGMMGKYLNGYLPRTRHIPPGWTSWDVAGNGYPEFNYNLLEDGRIVHYASAPSDYLTDVLARKGAAFVDQAANARRPFTLELATFAPHAPYTPAPRDANAFPGLRAPRPPSFNRANVNPPPWLKGHQPLTAAQIAGIDAAFRKRAQAVRAVDDLIGRIQGRLRARGLAQNTYIVFSSDNGYHMGEHRLTPGKLTAFETDIRVPLIVTGPDVVAGRNVARVTENVDLYPTFVRLGRAGASPFADGKSLLPLLRGQPAPSWRDAALVEHHGPDFGVEAGPDAAQAGSGNPSTYEALRLQHAVYVEYANGEREYYDLRSDPYELTNTYPELSPSQAEVLHSQLARLESCSGAANCQSAAGPGS
jgi:N-acetylglucosamine-6-sulfatase